MLVDFSIYLLNFKKFDLRQSYNILYLRTKGVYYMHEFFKDIYVLIFSSFKLNKNSFRKITIICKVYINRIKYSQKITIYICTTLSKWQSRQDEWMTTNSNFYKCEYKELLQNQNQSFCVLCRLLSLNQEKGLSRQLCSLAALQSLFSALDR